MTAMRTMLQPLAVTCLCAALIACGSATVVRQPARSKPVATKPAPAKRTPAPRRGGAVTVRKGDTLYRIATDHGISALDLAMWNQIPPPYTIFPGQRLRLSPPAPAVTARPSPVVRPPATRPPATSPPSGTSTTKPSHAVAGFAWRWPADGQIITRYVADDPTKQGIDIAGRSGSAVRAAADGVVVYSGAGLVGYGELIIVKHNEQWLSAYGHNRARLVNEGQRVKAGEQIAEMGRSGASRDMLHFEIRYNGKPQDPLLALPKR